MKKKFLLLALVPILTVISLISCNSSAVTSDKKTEPSSTEQESNSTKKEEESQEEKEKKAAEIKVVEDTITKNLGEYSDNLGIYYYNLENGAEYNFDSDRKFMGASMRKFPIVMSIADDIHSGKLTLDTDLIYNEETDKMGGSGVLQGEKVIPPISVKYAMELSMKFSDNIAHRMLMRTSSRSIAEYVTDISGEKMEDPYLSPKQMASLYKRLYTNPDNNPHYAYIVELLKNTVYHDRIDKYLPHDKVAHKIGDYYRFFHDSAIVYSDNPYVLVIMSKDIGTLKPGTGDHDERLLDDEGVFACEFIAKLAKELDNNLEVFHKQ